MTTTSDTVRSMIEAHHMLTPGDSLVVAVSGGADSMALLHAMAVLRREWRLTVHAAHLNHRLRPDADEDAAFIMAVADRLAVPVTIRTVDVGQLAAREKRSIEDAGRQARYTFFGDVAAAVGARCVATAHTRDDQIETVLMRLAQGGPWELLAGIPLVRPLGQATVIRPLSQVTRDAVRDELHREGIPWREDPTNQDRRMLRNRIRHEWLPALVQETPDLPAALWQMGEAARAVADEVDRLAAAVYGHVSVRDDEGVMVPVDVFRRLSAVLQRRLIRLAVHDVAGTDDAVPRVVEDSLVRVAASARTGSEVSGGGVVVRVGYEEIEVRRAAPAAVAAEYRLEIPGEVAAVAFGLLFTAEGPSVPTGSETSEGTEDAVFDAQCVGDALVIRGWRPGDRFSLRGVGGKKKLQDFFVDAKVPRWARARVPLVLDAQGRILWIVGHRFADECRVNARTEQVVRVRVRSA